MARSVNIQTRTRFILLLLACCAGAVASENAVRPSGAASSFNSSETAVGVGLPWWKKSLAHTVQEEWAFAMLMEHNYGSRWRTTLPDKLVLKLYQQFSSEMFHP